MHLWTAAVQAALAAADQATAADHLQTHAKQEQAGMQLEGLTTDVRSVCWPADVLLGLYMQCGHAQHCVAMQAQHDQAEAMQRSNLLIRPQSSQEGNTACVIMNNPCTMI
jgi:hypothetical protein